VDFDNDRVRTCVIFNPAARGDKARRFREHLQEISHSCAVKPTAAAGDARRLAVEAVGEGFETIIAAGGDGTINEVLNGLAEAPEGLTRSRLAVLPLGTVNVFARELRLPRDFSSAWSVIQRGKELRIDLPWAEFLSGGAPVRRYFAQLGGAGLDARAVELVSWRLKKKIGPLAYVAAGIRAIAEPQAMIAVSDGAQTASGALVLIGNGKLYGGDYGLFPKADMSDGVLDVCVFPQANLGTLMRCGPELLFRNKVPDSQVKRMEARTVRLTSERRVPFELDGELAGELPVTFSVDRSRLRVVVP
jgi:YegS/Rv2252/BmrU family lipid kinase